MKRLRRLCEATRLISPAAQITLHGVPDREDLWVIRVTVANIILVETGAGLLERVIVEAAKKLQAMSQRVLLAVSPNGDESPDADDDDTTPPTPLPVTKK